MPTLTILDGARRGKVYLIGDEALIGRSRDCDVVLPCDTVSRRHARIFLQDSAFYVEDLKSTNGVYINSRKIQGPCRLVDQDEIRIDSELMGFSESQRAYERRAGPVDADSDTSEQPAIIHILDVSGADLRAAEQPEIKFSAMLKIIRSLGVTLALSEVVANILDGLAMVFPQASQLDAMLEEGPEQKLKLYKRRLGAYESLYSEARTPRPISHSLAKMVMRQGKAILSADSNGESYGEGEIDASGVSLDAVETRMHTVMCAPLKCPSRPPSGLIYVTAPDSSRPFNKDDLDVLAGVAALLGRAVESSRAYETDVEKERLAAIGQMMASVAHESNNDLLSIQWGLKMIGKKISSMLAEEEADELLETVAQLQTHQQHLQRTFDDIQHFAGPMKLEKSITKLDDIWREAWSQLEKPRLRRDAELVEQAAGVDLGCAVDVFRIRQVFRNLFDNALAASVKPARIEVRCAETFERGVSALIVAVCDNGTGISDEDREHLFEPFFSTKPRGTGLGLPIIRRIVEAHGGYIEARDVPQGGAEFRFLLPK